MEHAKRTFGQSDAQPFLWNWVLLKIVPGAEQSTWTRLVLGVLGNIHDDRFQVRNSAIVNNAKTRCQGAQVFEIKPVKGRTS